MRNDKYFDFKRLLVICLAIFNLFIICESYGQLNEGRVNVSEIYHSHLEKSLFPEIKGADEIISFMEAPSFEPESSIRIIQRDNNCVIEGRFFKKNHWEEIFPMFKYNKVEVPEPEITFYSVPISKGFANNMQLAFSDVIMKLKNPEYNRRPGTDGSSFILRLYTDKGVISKKISNPVKGDIEYDIIALCSKVANDIKNGSFNELKYKEELK